MINRAEDITFVLGANTARFRQGMGVAGDVLRGFFKVGAVGGVALAAGLAKARQAVSDLDKVGKDARAGGLSPEAYQEVVFAADLAGLSVSELNKGLRTLTKNSNDAALGTGLMKTTLEKVNPELLENIKNSKTQEERIKLVADAVKNSTNEIEKAAIAQAAFGTKGTTFINFLDQGADGLNTLAQEARNLGIIIDNDVVANAENMNDQLSIASRVIDANLTKAFINLAPILVDITSLISQMAVEVSDLIDGFRELENRSSRGLDTQVADNGLKKIEIENRILELKDKQRNVTGVLADAERKVIQGTINGLQKELDLLDQQDAKVVTILKNREKLATTKATADAADTAPLRDLSPAKASRSGSTRSATISEAEKQAQAIAGVVEALTFELEQLSRNETQQRIYNELKSAGVDINSAAGEQISTLVGKIETENRTLEQNEAILQRIADRQQAIQDGNEFLIDSAAQVGVAFTEGSEQGVKALKALIVQLIAAYAQAKLLGTGPLAGLFGGVGFSGGSSISPAASLAIAAGTGGLYAKGGISSRPAIFGEAGPEAAVPLPDGRSIPVSFKDADFSGGKSDMNFTLVSTINADGATAETVKQIENAVQVMSRDFQKNVRAVVSDDRSRARDR